MLRARDGKMHVLPSLIENAVAPADGGNAGKKASTAAGTPVRLGKLELINGTIDFFDATVRQPAHRLRLEKINAVIGPL